MIDGAQFVILSGVLSFGTPLAFAVHELIVLRRPGKGQWPGDEAPEIKPQPMPPEAPKRLPECLIPKLPTIAARGRVLEDA